MRDVTSWYASLANEMGLEQHSVDPLQIREFFAVEAALTFLADHFPDEPVENLWTLLSGFALCHPSDRVMQARVRRLSLLLGRYRTGSRWSRSLQEYDKVPERLRVFLPLTGPLGDPYDEKHPGSRRYRMREPTIGTSRIPRYRSVLDEPVPYAPPRLKRNAEFGETYWFMNTDSGDAEEVFIPEVEVPEPLNHLPLVAERTRKAVELPPEALTAAAARMDRALDPLPQIEEKNFTGRLRKITYFAWDQSREKFTKRRTDCRIEGLQHGIGLPNSGKTSYALIATVAAVDNGYRVALVLPSVGHCLKAVTMFDALGISAVPLIGVGLRQSHANGYWQGVFAESAPYFPSRQDPAVDYVTVNCLLEPHRWAPGGRHSPLRARDFPCREKLFDVEGDAYNCPLIPVCPFHRATQRVADAQVWLTTPAGLISSWAQPVDGRLRWLELFQHLVDLLIVDEADKVQQQLDETFLQSQVLIREDDSWWDTEVINAQTGLGHSARLSFKDERVTEYFQAKNVADGAANALYRVLLEPEAGSAQLRKHLDGTYFSGHSLFIELARSLQGLSPNSHGDPDREERAQAYYRKNFEQFVFHTFAPTAEGPLGAAVPWLATPLMASKRLSKALDEWLLLQAHPSARRTVAKRLDYLRQLLRAAYQTSMLGSAYLHMATVRPAVQQRLELPGDEKFWSSRPPADYDALVPEAPQGNMLAFQWINNRRDTGNLRVFWVRGIGRWLLHHLHDLLSPEGIDGPNTLLLSATSWAGHSSAYHVGVPVSFILREPPQDRAAIARSQFHFRPALVNSALVSPAGKLGDERQDAVRRIAAYVAGTGGPSLLASVLADLPENRRKALLVGQSKTDARTVATYIVRHTPFSALHVVSDDSPPGRWGIQRRNVPQFGLGDDDVLAAALLSIERALNILNAEGTAALGVVFFLVRPHPPPTELDFPMGNANRRAMRLLENPVIDPASLADVAREIRKTGRAEWHMLLGRPVVFRHLRGPSHQAFVWDTIPQVWQTICRCIRGGQPAEVYFCDPAFAPRRAAGEAVPDTVHTSILIAMQRALRRQIHPGSSADSRDQQAAEVLYGLMLQCLENMDWGTR
ncbi:hypothetical protein ABZW03_09940 [Kitasatospora sp. NPDC004799]|uniref:pPIWI_RE_Z domain-containing protein n=1 Tax=Kitasatospora sp. NPDC004799 TaxID=3154460 RepID=UPI0033BCD6E6